MKSDKASNKASVPQLMKFNGAFKLVELWFNDMSKLDGDDESVKVKGGGRPLRLAVGATFPRESKIVHSDDPVERRIRAKLETDKKKLIKPLDGSADQDSDDEELESKTKAFGKKRPLNWTSTLQAKKNHK